MSAEIVDFVGGILTTRLSGKVTHAEVVAMQKLVGDILRQEGRARFLSLLENFEGLEQTGNWGDLSFQMEFDDRIEKIAVVGDKQWADGALMFTGKGIRRMPIEFFATEDLAKAKAWLAA
jgi:hypothetical protein